MATVTAQLKNYRQSPRKVRLVADLIRGKSVAEALTQLTFLTKHSGLPVKKLIESAVANAKSQDISITDWFIKEIRVDKGVTLHRIMPRARGRAFPINKRSSHVLVVLDTEKPGRKAKTTVSNDSITSDVESTTPKVRTRKSTVTKNK